MDWFLRWPKEALIQVAEQFLSSYKIECTDETKQNVVQVSSFAYLSTARGRADSTVANLNPVSELRFQSER